MTIIRCSTVSISGQAYDAFDASAARRQLRFVQTRPGRFGAYLPAHTPSPPALADLNRPAHLALYLVYEIAGPDKTYTRAVTVEPVHLAIR